MKRQAALGDTEDSPHGEFLTSSGMLVLIHGTNYRIECHTNQSETPLLQDG
jgi:hypothetical protein